MPPVGFKHSAETKRRISEKKKAQHADPNSVYQSDEYRRKKGEQLKNASRMRGKKHSPETKAKMSAARRGKKMSDEARQNMSRAQKAASQPMTPERQAKLEQGKQKAFTEGRLKCRSGCTCGRHDSERLSDLAKRLWADGVFDGRKMTYGNSGCHNGVDMRCLNSEGVFAKVLDENDILWQYEPKRFKLSWCSYTPDFYLPEFDIWVEVKGKPEQPGDWPQRVETFRKETGKTLVLVFQSELPSRFYHDTKGGQQR